MAETLSRVEMRRSAIERRRNIDPEKRREMDLDIYRECISQQAYTWAEYLLCYVNYNDETDTHRLIRKAIQDGKNVYVPKVIDPADGEMEFYHIGSLVETEKGYHGIPEPVMTSKNSFETVYSKMNWSERGRVLIIVPGVAFDYKLGRLGYGRGFYDRYLSAHPDAVSIGICYDCQLMKDVEIPVNEHDVRIRFLITNS